jgi:O-antigen biosynthesis protein
MLDVLEFPGLAAQADRIEWRDTVGLAELPNELARFDINLAPLEIGNPYCEAKSELKYFEAALADVCTVASSTEPMASAIRHRETGMLADSSEAWYEALKLLVGDSELRGQLAHAAYLDVLWRYGPRQRAESVKSLLDQVAGGHDAARGFELQLRQRHAPRTRSPELAPADIVFAANSLGIAEVSVIIPLYHYADYVTDALESVRAQSLQAIDLIVVDDCSTDDSLQVAKSWAEQQAQTDRFNRIVVLGNRVNQGLARTRNVGIDAAETEFVVPLDADNRLLPDFCARTLQSLRGTNAAFAYTKIQCFGSKDHVIGLDDFSPGRFVHSNYIDAMALVAKDAWAAVGGYTHIQHGWEDYDFWCCCVEHGIWGVHVPEILAEYRFHEKSMLRTVTEIRDNKLQVIRELESRHPWLSIGDRE